MSSQLIPVFQSDSQQLLCNARDLHAFLEVGRDFSTWIKDRIEQYGFIGAEDYITVKKLSSPNPGSAKARAQQLADYHLTLDMAKELAMIENNAMGRRVRRYFIQRERQAIELLQQQADSVRPLEEVRAEIGDTPKFRYLLILQEQSRSCARQLDQAQGAHERYTLHCQLRQINNVLGIPTQSLDEQQATDKLTKASHFNLSHSHKEET